MMYYALTINTDHIITGVHESMHPIATDTFSANPVLSEDTVVVIDSPAEFQANVNIRCYNEDGTLKPLIWCIENGFMAIPPNMEIINGELVDKKIPTEEQPQTLKRYLDEQFSSIRQETAPAQKAATVMFRALAQTDVITPVDALDNAAMFPLWAGSIGQRAEAGSYWRHNDTLWRVNAGQGHTIQADWAPDAAPSLFSLAANPAEEWPEWRQPAGQHDAYAKGAKVTHNGQHWVSGYEANTWEPGVYGWEQTA